MSKVTKEDLERIRKTQWYKQGGEIIPWFVAIPYLQTQKVWGRQNSIFFNQGLKNEGFFNKAVETKLARETLSKNESSTSHIKKKIAEWREKSRKAKKELAKDIKSMSDREFIKTLSRVSDLLAEQWQTVIMIELFDPCGHELFEEYLRESGIALSPKEKEAGLAPELNSFTVEEFLDRYKIAEKAGKEPGKLDRLAESHAREYFWTGNSWAHTERISKEEFIKKIRGDIRNFDEMKRKHDRIKRQIKEKKENRKALMSRIKNRRVLNILRFFQLLSDWREERKRDVLITNHYLYGFLEELSKRSGADKKLLEFAVPSEIESTELSRKYAETLKKRRKKHLVMCNREGKRLWLYGKEMDKVVKTLRESIKKKDIRGIAANGGNARGKARIVMARSDFSRVKKGEVLVAIMTRPEFSPVMEKASAFVTDEGGITCHAAIVSREMGKPCIVGTQTATISLKDGEEVEVEADKGIVRRIK